MAFDKLPAAFGKDWSDAQNRWNLLRALFPFGGTSDILSGGNRWYGIVKALPTKPTPVAGDRCAFEAAANVLWLFVFDGTWWNFIGGPPLIAASNVERALAKEPYTSLPTDPLSIVVPLQGDYDITISGNLNNVAANRNALLSYSIGAAEAKDEWAIQVLSASTVATSPSLKTRQAGIAAAAKIEEKGRSVAAAEVKFTRRRLEVLPVKVK